MNKAWIAQGGPALLATMEAADEVPLAHPSNSDVTSHNTPVGSLTWIWVIWTNFDNPRLDPDWLTSITE